MNNVLRWISSVSLSLSLAACGSDSSPLSPARGSGGSSASSAGNTAVNPSGGSPAGGNAASGGSGLSGAAGSATSSGGSSAGAGAVGGAINGGAPTAGTSGSSGTSGAAGESGGGASGAAAGGSNGAGAGAGGGMAAGSGGQDAGAAGGPTGPELVTSGPNAYWDTQQKLTTVESTTADLSVDENTKYQRFDGFGGTFNEMGWDALSVLDPAEVTRALELLFDRNKGAGFVYGRIPIGASDYAMSWYTLAETAGDYAMEHFSIERDRQKLIPYIKAALEIQSNIHLWGSPWIPPAWMKEADGKMKSDAQTQGAYALYLAKFVEEYAKEGLKIEAVHPQNEPGYASVKWSQSLFIDFFKTYLGPTFEERKVPAQIWCGTMSAPEDGTIATTLAADPDAMKYVKGFGLQWNLQGTVAALAPKGLVWQTEHKCGNYNFETPYWDRSRYDANKPQNDHLYGEESWQLIRDWLVAGVNAYSAWNMVLDTGGKSLGNWPQNALLVVDRSAKKLILTPAYYTFRHYSHYIAPGATRIAVSGSMDAVAFKNPDGSIVTEVYNKGDAAKRLTIGVGNSFYQFETPAHGWATLRVTP